MIPPPLPFESGLGLSALPKQSAPSVWWRQTSLWGVLALALVVRLIAWQIHPDTYPDAYFQYLEPAWWHLEGYGYQTWEWEVGLRSWIPPAYYGAWMAFWDLFGLKQPGFLSAFFALHSIALGLWAVLGVKRLATGLHSPQAGLIAACLAAASPMMAYYTTQTLIETPAVAIVMWGLALMYGPNSGAPPSKKATETRIFWAAFFLSLGGMLRLPFAIGGAFVAFDVVVTRRWHLLKPLMLGALGPIVAFGLIDWLTWGKPFHSSLAFFKYHAEGKGAEHGAVRETSFYLTLMWQRAGVLIAMVVASWALVPKRLPLAWKVLALLALAIGPQMANPQKLERFILLAWPLVMVLAGMVFAHLAATYGKQIPTWLKGLALSVVAALSVVQGSQSLAKGPKEDYAELWGLFEAQREVVKQPDLTGVLIDSRLHLTAGSFGFGQNIAYARLSHALAQNRIFNYFILEEASLAQGWVKQLPIERLQSFGKVRLWHIYRRKSGETRPLLPPKKASADLKRTQVLPVQPKVLYANDEVLTRPSLIVPPGLLISPRVLDSWAHPAP